MLENFCERLNKINFSNGWDREEPIAKDIKKNIKDLTYKGNKIKSLDVATRGHDEDFYLDITLKCTEDEVLSIDKKELVKIAKELVKQFDASKHKKETDYVDVVYIVFDIIDGKVNNDSKSRYSRGKPYKEYTVSIQEKDVKPYTVKEYTQIPGGTWKYNKKTKTWYK